MNSEPAVSCTFPDPPPHYANYTDENIARGRVPEPPRPINDGTYSMFGVTMINDDTIIRPLELQGIKRLYPRDYDHKRELKKMNASILVNFLDLIDVLVKCPDTAKREEKCADIAMLFVQMHHLINELRPHQARETIRVTLQCQKRQRNEIIARLNKQIDRVHDIISGCINNIPEVGDSKAGLEDLMRSVCVNGQGTNGFSDDGDAMSVKEEPEINELDAIMCSIVDELPIAS